MFSTPFILDFSSSSWKKEISEATFQEATSVTIQKYEPKFQQAEIDLSHIGMVRIEESDLSEWPVFLKGLELAHITIIDSHPGNNDLVLEGFSSLKSLQILDTKGKVLVFSGEWVQGLTELTLRDCGMAELRVEGGQMTSLKEMEIFNCLNFRQWAVGNIPTLTRLRIGSQRDGFQGVEGLESFPGIKTLIIDNWKSSDFSLESVAGSGIEHLKIWCPSDSQFQAIAAMPALRRLDIVSQTRCKSNGFLHPALRGKETLIELSLYIDKSTSPEDLGEWLNTFPALEFVEIRDSRWESAQKSKVKQLVASKPEWSFRG